MGFVLDLACVCSHTSRGGPATTFEAHNSKHRQQSTMAIARATVLGAAIVVLAMAMAAPAPARAFTATGPLRPAPREGNNTLAIDAAVRSYFSTQEAMDCKGFAGLFADSFSLEDPNDSPAVTSKSDVENNCEGAGQAFSKVVLFTTDIRVAGNGAAAYWTCKSVTRDNCQMDFTGIDSFEFNDAIEITSVRGYYDVSIPARQFNCSGSASE